jgi:hypothetical protein
LSGKNSGFSKTYGLSLAAFAAYQIYPEKAEKSAEQTSEKRGFKEKPAEKISRSLNCNTIRYQKECVKQPHKA